MDNSIILNNIYSILLEWQSSINLITGFIQFLIVIVACYALYKLLNYFF